MPMNDRQKQAQHAQLMTEQSAVNGLREIYRQALEDIDAQIAYLNARQDQENLASIAFQRQYQENLRRQVSGILDQLNGEQFDTVSDFLTASYENGYVGAMYDMAGQGVPVIAPVDQAQVAKAVTTDSKLSKPLYDTLGEDVDGLKASIQQEVTRGVIQGKSYNEIARAVEKRMVGDYSKFNGGAYAKAARIARTEGHRVQNTAAYDAQRKAQSKGANIVKQWDATLDGRTRDSHAKVDGELRPLDEEFSNGLLFPGDPHGEAAEVVNCRCALLQRAKWALDQDELDRLQQRAEYYGLDKSDSFEDFKAKYLKAAANGGTITYTSDESVFAGIVHSQVGMTQDYEDILQRKFAFGSDAGKKAFNKFVSGDSVADSAYNGAAHYSSSRQKVYMDYAADRVNPRGAGTTFFHEHGHFMYHKIGQAQGFTSQSAADKSFRKALRKDFKACVQAAKDEYKAIHGVECSTDYAYWMMSQKVDTHETHAISDLWGGLSKNKVKGRYGHKTSYWTGDALENEAFAHMFDAQFNPVKRDLMEQYFPSAFSLFEQMLQAAIV